MLFFPYIQIILFIWGLFARQYTAEEGKNQPKLPKSREETHEAVQEYELKSSNNEDMIYKNDVDTKIIKFTTESNLRCLCQDVHLFANGTFQYCPKYFLPTLYNTCIQKWAVCVFSSSGQNRGNLSQYVSTSYWMLYWSTVNT